MGTETTVLYGVAVGAGVNPATKVTRGDVDLTSALLCFWRLVKFGGFCIHLRCSRQQVGRDSQRDLAERLVDLDQTHTRPAAPITAI